MLGVSPRIDEWAEWGTEPLLSQRRLNGCFPNLRIDPLATAMDWKLPLRSQDMSGCSVESATYTNGPY
jgi:hypothetical protein